MSSLDVLAAQMVTRARQVERAVHDPGPWTVRAGGEDSPVRRVVGEDHVSFIGLVPLDGPGVVELRCGGETVAVRSLPGIPGLAQLVWEFVVDAQVNA